MGWALCADCLSIVRQSRTEKESEKPCGSAPAQAHRLGPGSRSGRSVIANQISTRQVEWAGLNHLLSCPRRGRMLGHVEVKDSSPLNAQDKEHIDDAIGHGRHDCKVDCEGLVQMVVQKGRQSLLRTRRGRVLPRRGDRRSGWRFVVPNGSFTICCFLRRMITPWEGLECCVRVDSILDTRNLGLSLSVLNLREQRLRLERSYEASCPS